MRTTILLIIILSTSFAVIAGSQPQSIQQETAGSESSIISLVHSPYIPTTNDTVQFQVQLQLSGSPSIDNVTLNYYYNETSYSQTMNMNSSTSYLSEINFSDSGEVTYFVELFESNVLVETSEIRHITIISDQANIAHIVADNGIPILLRSGNYTVTTPSYDLELNFSTTTSSNLTISEINKVDNPPANNELINTAYDISTNNSVTMENVTLSLSYNQSVLSDLGTSPELLTIHKRENSTSNWVAVNSTLDEEGRKLITEPSSFSQWVITAGDPLLQFVEVTKQITTRTNSLTYVNTVIGNLGGIKAENVNVRMIIPESLTSANESLNITFNELMPRENITITWVFSGQQYGEYNLISLLEGANSEGDLAEIQISINDTDSSTDQNDGASNQSTNQTANISFLHSYILIISLLVIGSKRKGEE